jgi:trans-2,3-dihydro-3-hydroxyanthranilate isomerase
MRQAQPVFGATFTPEEVSEALGIGLEAIDTAYPIREVSTGLPYIIIPLKNLRAMESLVLQYEALKQFLLDGNRYRTNSKTGQSTSLYFFTKAAYEADNTYNARMLLIENDKLMEDAATGSAGGCLLAYLLKYDDDKINVTVEQGFQMGRKSYLYLDGKWKDEQYEINVGGHIQMVSAGVWYV